MPYSKDHRDYEPSELNCVAELYYLERKTHEAIGAMLNMPRAKVVAMCEAARLADIVRVVIMPSRVADRDRLRILASQVRTKFDLLEVVIVDGAREMLEQKLDENMREAIMDDIARHAARELERRFDEADSPCLAVTFGFMARKVTDYIQPRTTLAREGHGLVIAAKGVRRVEMDRFGAVDIVRDMARRFGCRCISLPIPALVPGSLLERSKSGNLTVHDMPLVGPALDVLDEQTNIVFTSLASRHSSPSSWDSSTDSVTNTIFTEEQKTFIKKDGGIGNLGEWWFRADGSSAEYPDGMRMVGLGLEKIKGLVKRKRPVIVAVGADPKRIPALFTAFKRGLVNVWIGDEATAQVLLGNWKITRPRGPETLENPDAIDWDDTEEEILRGLCA